MLRNIRLSLSATISCAFLLFSTITPVNADQQSLKDKYQAVKAYLENNSYGVPIYIESYSSKDSPKGDIYGVIPHPFSAVKQSLSYSDNWCDIAPLHPNIKACTYQKLNGNYRLIFYSGRKYFQYPEDTHMLDYLFEADTRQDDYLLTNMVASDGPLGTSNYSAIVEAIPLDNASTFIHFSYSYNQTFWTRIAMSTYLATIGRDKVGFTIVGDNTNGEPMYIDGIRGVIERNAMRYYFAIQAYLDTMNAEPEKKFESRLTRWFELTEPHKKQLYEMEKKKYLEIKQKERVEQNRLQQELK